MRRTKEEAEVTRKTLLDAGLKVFSRVGYADATLDDIADEAGVTRGAIYHHFGGKAELYNTVIAEGWERVIPAIESAVAGEGTVLEKLRRAFVRFLTYAEQDETFRAVNELTLFKTALLPELEEGMEMKRVGTRRGIEDVTTYVQIGIEEGSIRPDIDPHIAATIIITLQNGLFALWLMDPSLFSLKDRAEQMADIIFDGLAAR
jgi:TetR/AcrR family acrAB operon transcriptional repressor